MAAPQRPRRWPLGLLYVLTLGLAAGLAIRLLWLYTYGRDNHTMSWHWLALELWLLLAGVGLLALWLGLANAFRRQAGRAVAWLLLSIVAIGSCAAASFPVVMVTVIAPSVGDPPHVYDE